MDKNQKIEVSSQIQYDRLVSLQVALGTKKKGSKQTSIKMHDLNINLTSNNILFKSNTLHIYLLKLIYNLIYAKLYYI